MNVRIMLVVNKFLASVLGSKTSFDSFAVLPGSAREPISDPDVEHRVIAIGNDVDPEVVITDHHSEFKFRDVSTSLGMTKVLSVNRAHGISEIEGKAAKGSGERVGNERVSNSWLILKSKAQHLDGGGDFDVLVADDEI
jgi:hypothetical protein